MVAQARCYGRQTESSLDLCSSKITTKLVKNNFGQHLSELVNILIKVRFVILKGDISIFYLSTIMTV
jgi:hypothetical protein